jgi:hypothetical protein
MLSEDELAGVPLLVFSNKQDIAGALRPEEISEKLGLAGGETKREWSVRGSCATKGEGLEDGLDWYVLLSHCKLLPCFPVAYFDRKFHAERTSQAGECDTQEVKSHHARCHPSLWQHLFQHHSLIFALSNSPAHASAIPYLITLLSFILRTSTCLNHLLRMPSRKAGSHRCCDVATNFFESQMGALIFFLGHSPTQLT